MAAANLASSDNAASMAMDDHRRSHHLELLLLALLTHSLLRKDDADEDGRCPNIRTDEDDMRHGIQ